MMREKIYIKTPFIKLSAMLKFCGVANTGGEAKAMILSGSVNVGGEVCLINGKKLFPGNIVTTGGKEYEVAEE